MKAIIFDMDGVLVDAMPFHYQAMSMRLKNQRILTWIKGLSTYLKECRLQIWL